MNTKKDLLESLLRGLEIIENIRIDQYRQFYVWTSKVSSALQGADMVEELEIWQKASAFVPASPIDTSIYIQIEALRAVLLGFLEKVQGKVTSEVLIPVEIYKDTRGYIKKIAEQVNGCYQSGYYDACTVMVRRLLETLIIECFEKHNLGAKILDDRKNYLYLSKLISVFTAEQSWHLSRSIGGYLERLKTFGDASAHSRDFTASKSDIEKLADPIRFSVQALLQIAGF